MREAKKLLDVKELKEEMEKKVEKAEAADKAAAWRSRTRLAFRDAEMSKCKYNTAVRKKQSQQSRIATCNEEEKTEKMPVNKSEM